MTTLYQTELVEANSIAAAGYRVRILAQMLGFSDAEAVCLGLAARELALALNGHASPTIALGLDHGTTAARLTLAFSGDQALIHPSPVTEEFFDDVELSDGEGVFVGRQLPDPGFDPSEEWLRRTAESIATLTASELRTELERKNYELERLLAERAEQADELEHKNQELQEANEELEKLRAREYQLARFDSVTGLPTRTLFLDRLHQAIALAHRHELCVAVMFVDLDHFKQINDTFGHAAGDNILREVGNRMADCVRQSDTVARLGGDEFAVILQDLRSTEDGGTVARNLVAAVRDPIAFGGHDHGVSASIGVAIFPDHGEAAQELIDQADHAMYAVKNDGRSGYRIAADLRLNPDGSNGR